MSPVMAALCHLVCPHFHRLASCIRERSLSAMARRSAALSILTLLLFPISTIAQDAAAHVRSGMLTPAATVNPFHQPVSQALSSAAQSRPKGARPIHPAH